MNIVVNCLKYWLFLLLASAAFAADEDSSRRSNQKSDGTAQTENVKAVPDAYTLSPNDLVLIKVFQEDDLTRELRLAKDGSIDFPLIGVINLGGKTLSEANKVI